jgi:hypothetical protein
MNSRAIKTQGTLQAIAASRRTIVQARFIFIIVFIAAAAACAVPGVIFCNNCSSTAATHCTSLGRVVCNYSCSTGICAGINASCNFDCCLPPPPPVAQEAPVAPVAEESGH